MPLFVFFLTAYLLSEPAGAYVVVDPYAAKGTIIQNPVFDSVFLDQLYAESTIPVLQEGAVDFYLAEEKNCFSAVGGICTAVFCGNAICGSKKFETPLGKPAIDYGLVTGNKELHDGISTKNALRYAAISSAEYLSLVEKNIAQMQGTGFDSQYIQERYGFSVERLINEEIRYDGPFPAVEDLLKRGEIDLAISEMDKYFSQNYGISTAYDSYDLFSAVKQRQIGPVQYSELLSSILRQNNVNIPMDALTDKSKILNDAFNKQAIDAAFDMLKSRPELFDGLKKAMDAVDTRMFNELLSKVLAESFKNKELLKKYLELLPDIMKDKKMQELFFKSSAEAVRKMQETGALAKLMENINDIKVREQIMAYAKDSAPSAFNEVAERLRALAEEKYLIPLIGLLIILAVSMKVRL